MTTGVTGLAAGRHQVFVDGRSAGSVTEGDGGRVARVLKGEFGSLPVGTAPTLNEATRIVAGVTAEAANA